MPVVWMKESKHRDEEICLWPRGVEELPVLTNANNYLAIRVSMDSRRNAALTGSYCSDDTPRTSLTFAALTTGFQHRGTQAPRGGRLL